MTSTTNALLLTEEETVAYIALLSQFALLDGKLDEIEMVLLLCILECADLSPENNNKLCSLIDRKERSAEELKEYAVEMRKSKAKSLLMVDLCTMALQDNNDVATLLEEEKEALTKVSQSLLLPDNSLHLFSTYASHFITASTHEDYLTGSGVEKEILALNLPTEVINILRTGSTPASILTRQSVDILQEKLSELQLEANNEDASRGLGEADASRGLGEADASRGFTSYFCHSMKRSAKRNLLAALLHKITGTRRPHSMINFAYFLTGRRKVSRRPGNMLHMAGSLVNMFS